MLEAVSIANEASFGANAQELTPLKRINFIYGANGSGKTTISRVIASESDFPSCALSWRNGNEIQRLVYNRHFVEANYTPRMRGIFTLGEESADTLARIEECRRSIAELRGHLDNRKHTLEGADGKGGKLKEQRDLRAKLERDCWDVKGSHDPHFQDAFTGFRGAAKAFCDKVLLEKDVNQADLHDVEALKKRVATVFAKGLQPEALIGLIVDAPVIECESSPILAKPVVGKEDVDVAALIRKLGNSDWVRQGLEFVPHSDGSCPFCQQGLPHDIEARLNLYFDETFARDMASIDRVLVDYRRETEAIMTGVADIIAAAPRYLDAVGAKALSDRFADRVDANLQRLETKKKEPSAVMALEPTGPIVVELNTLFEKANADAREQNDLLANLAAEQTSVTSQVWRHVLEEAQASLTAFATDGSAVDAAIRGLQGSIAQKQGEMAEQTAELQRLERSITSVEPTVTEINKLLASFGFRGFKLATAGEGGGQYVIVRPNGADATPTLSEGEKTFVTFLYFYHLLRGSASETGVTIERIVVIDDPVSSLDSDILFIVSSLIKRLLVEARAGTGLIKQVILLTHNIYFHKEVSFDPDRQGRRADETFWVVKKRDEQSIIVGFDHNPVRTSYDLLWSEVRGPHRSNLTIQNTLRRILENYFKILGNIDRDATIELFDGQDKMICGALFSWINDGSHFAPDDLYVTHDDETIEKFLTVFRAVFERSGHSGHYRMMMGDAYVELAAPEPVVEIEMIQAPDDTMIQILPEAAPPEDAA